MRSFLSITIISILLVSMGCARQRVTEITSPDSIESAGEPSPPPSTPEIMDQLKQIANFGGDEFAGWKLASPIRTYDKKTIYDYIDGAGELYIAYDFIAVATAEYKDDGNSIIIDIYDMSAPKNAFGIYSLNRYQGANFVNIGNEGILTGPALDFWKGRYFCKVYSLDMSEKYQSDVIKFATNLAEKIQEAGERPSVIEKLPQKGMIPKTEKFFSRKLGLDNIHFVSEEDVFNLDGETEGAIAEYQLDNDSFELFVIRYPSSEKANSAFESYVKYLDEKGESVSAGKSNKMVRMDGEFAFVEVEDQYLKGFWGVQAKELAESVLSTIIE